MCIHYFLIKRKKLFGRPNTCGDFDIIDYYNFISRLFIKRIDTFNNRLKLVLRASNWFDWKRSNIWKNIYEELTSRRKF